MSKQADRGCALPRRFRLLVVAMLSALLSLSVVSHSQAASSVCLPSAERTVAKVLHVTPRSLLISVDQGSNGMPQCLITTRRGAHVRPRVSVKLIINVDDGPQAAKRLGDQVEEATQIFGPTPPGWKAPQGLYGLGPFASWFPNQHYLKGTNEIDLITVTVSWRSARKVQQILLARGAITPYVRHHGNLV